MYNIASNVHVHVLPCLHIKHLCTMKFENSLPKFWAWSSSSRLSIRWSYVDLITSKSLTKFFSLRKASMNLLLHVKCSFRDRTAMRTFVYMNMYIYGCIDKRTITLRHYNSHYNAHTFSFGEVFDSTFSKSTDVNTSFSKRNRHSSSPSTFSMIWSTHFWMAVARTLLSVEYCLSSRPIRSMN